MTVRVSFIGLLLFILGMLIDWAEVNSKEALPSSFGWGILVIIVVGAAMIPVSGFYLAIPPAIALITRQLRTDRN